MLLSLAGCSTTYNLFNADCDRVAYFNSYKTFAWVLPVSDSMDAQEQIIYGNTIDYFAHELAARNMTVDNEHPDLLFELKGLESKEQRQQRIQQMRGFNNYGNNFRFCAFSPYNR